MHPPTDASAPPPDPTRCPLCGQRNACAVETARATGEAPTRCWCMDTPFADGVLETIAPALRGPACICARCAAGATPRG